MISGYIHKLNKTWEVIIKDQQGFVIARNFFLFPEGAFKWWHEQERKAYYRERSREIIQSIDIRYLSVRENAFVVKLKKQNCLIVTKRQYGYLKGLAERNPL